MITVFSMNCLIFRGREEKKEPVTFDRESTSHKVRGAVVMTSSMRSSVSEYRRLDFFFLLLF